MVTATELQPTDLVEIHNLTKSHYLLPGGRTIRPKGVLKGIFLSQVSIEAQMDTQGENPRLAIVAAGVGLPTYTKSHEAPPETDIKIILPSEEEEEESIGLGDAMDGPSSLDKAALSNKTSRRRKKEDEADEAPGDAEIEMSLGGIASDVEDDTPGSPVMDAWLRRANDESKSDKVKEPEQKASPPRRGRRGSALRSK